MRTLQTSVDSSPAMDYIVSLGSPQSKETMRSALDRRWRPAIDPRFPLATDRRYQPRKAQGRAAGDLQSGSRPARAYARRHEMLQDIRELQKLLGLGYPTIEPGERREIEGDERS